MKKIFIFINGIIKVISARAKANVYNKAQFSDGFVGIDLGFLSDDEISTIIRDANELCCGYYQIYNYDHFILRDWLMDPVTEHSIPKSIHCSLIKVSTLAGNTDVKNYWELGHLHPIFTLAEAYRYSKDEKYAEQAVKILISFVKANKCGKTIHWKCCMDVAIRAVNIVQSAYLIHDSKAFKEYQSMIAMSIAEHVLFISDNYEDKADRRNNHYLTDLTGVIIAGVYLKKCYPQCEMIQQRLMDAVGRFERELKLQINPDGSDYENSTYYHCYVTELCCAVLDTLSENKIPFANDLINIRERMLGYCKWLGAFDKRLPLFGDQDGSRLYLATGFFDVNRCDFSYLTRIYGDGLYESDNVSESGIIKLQSGDVLVYVKCGEIGTGGRGVHDHNDQLSITIFYHEIPIVIDPGTFHYTKDPELRRMYRSTSSHNTLYVEQIEQNDIDSEMFRILNGRPGSIVESSATTFSGKFVYQSGLVHEREIRINENEIQIKDVISDLNDAAHVQFLLPEDIKMTQVSSTCVQCLIGSLSIMFDFNAEVKTAEKKYSPAYGRELNGHSISTTKAENENITRIRFSRRQRIG